MAGCGWCVALKRECGQNLKGGPKRTYLVVLDKELSVSRPCCFMVGFWFALLAHPHFHGIPPRVGPVISLFLLHLDISR